MAELNERQYTFAGLVVDAVAKIGSTKGQSLGVSVTGTGMTSSDSDYALHQSNDGTNWVLVTGAAFANLTNGTQFASLPDSFTMQFIGFVKTSDGTETTGTIDVIVTSK